MAKELTQEQLQERASALYEMAVRVSSTCEHLNSDVCEECTYIEVCKEVRKEDWSLAKDCARCGKALPLVQEGIQPRVELFFGEKSWVYVRVCSECLEQLKKIDPEEIAERFRENLKAELEKIKDD